MEIFNPLEIHPLKIVSRIGGVYSNEYKMLIINIIILFLNMTIDVLSLIYPKKFPLYFDTYNQVVWLLWTILFSVRLFFIKTNMMKEEKILTCFDIGHIDKICIENKIKIFCYKTPSIVIFLSIVVMFISLIDNYTLSYLGYCLIRFSEIFVASAWITTGDCLIGVMCNIYGNYIDILEKDIIDIIKNIDLELNDGQTLITKNYISQQVQTVIDNYDDKFKNMLKIISYEINVYAITHLSVVIISFGILIYRAIYDKSENIKSIINIWLLTICFSSTPFTELLTMISLPGEKIKNVVLKLKGPTCYLKSEQIWGDGEYLSKYIEEKDFSIKILGIPVQRKSVFKMLAGWVMVGGVFIIENFFTY